MKFILFLFLAINLYSANHEVYIFDKNTLIPIEGAIVSSEKEKTTTDKLGKANLHVEKRELFVKAYGYKQASVKNDTNIVLLEPFTSKALYISFWAAGSKKVMNRIIETAKQTEINTVIIDIKNEFGNISYKTGVKLAQDIGAHKKRTVFHMDKLVQRLHDENLYVIARIVVFKDERLAKSRPEYALKDPKTLKIWRNNERLAWVDPYEEKVHEYVSDIALDAAKQGFDEINFDYIRFPLKLSLSYKKELNQENRITTISKFLQTVNKKLKDYNIYTSVDTYGYVCWNEHDTNIGHTIKTLAQNVDYISPMLYPSGFSRGVLGYKDPTDHTYEIINRSIEVASERNNISPLRFKPWLQSFKDYAFDRKFFRSYEISQQIKGAENANASGWLLWNPSSKFSSKGLQDVVHPYPVLMKSKEDVSNFCRRVDFPNKSRIK